MSSSKHKSKSSRSKSSKKPYGRDCICGRGMGCQGLSAAFKLLKDPRGSYASLPSDVGDSSSSFLAREGQRRQAYLRYLTPPGTTKTRHKYVALHHFHPSIVQKFYNNKSTRKYKVPPTISLQELQQLSIPIDEQDRIYNDQGEPTSDFIFVPNYPFAKAQDDVKHLIRVQRMVKEFRQSLESSVDEKVKSKRDANRVPVSPDSLEPAKSMATTPDSDVLRAQAGSAYGFSPRADSDLMDPREVPARVQSKDVDDDDRKPAAVASSVPVEIRVDEAVKQDQAVVQEELDEKKVPPTAEEEPSAAAKEEEPPAATEEEEKPERGRRWYDPLRSSMVVLGEDDSDRSYGMDEPGETNMVRVEEHDQDEDIVEIVQKPSVPVAVGSNSQDDDDEEEEVQSEGEVEAVYVGDVNEVVAVMKNEIIPGADVGPSFDTAEEGQWEEAKATPRIAPVEPVLMSAVEPDLQEETAVDTTNVMIAGDSKVVDSFESDEESAFLGESNERQQPEPISTMEPAEFMSHITDEDMPSEEDKATVSETKQSEEVHESLDEYTRLMQGGSLLTAKFALHPEEVPAEPEQPKEEPAAEIEPDTTPNESSTEPQEQSPKRSESWAKSALSRIPRWNERKADAEKEPGAEVAGGDDATKSLAAVPESSGTAELASNSVDDKSGAGETGSSIVAAQSDDGTDGTGDGSGSAAVFGNLRKGLSGWRRGEQQNEGAATVTAEVTPERKKSRSRLFENMPKPFTELRNTLRTGELSRRAKYAEQIERLKNDWISYRSILNTGVSETHLASRSVAGTAKAMEAYAKNMMAVHNDVYIDDEGKQVTSTRMQNKLSAERKDVDYGLARDKSANSRVTQESGQSVLLKPLIESQSSLSENFSSSAQYYGECITELVNLDKFVTQHAAKLEKSGEACLRKINTAETDVRRLWDAFDDLFTGGEDESGSQSSGGNDEPNTPTRSTSTTRALKLLGSVQDCWLMEMYYRVAVVSEATIWNETEAELASLYDSITDLEVQRRSRLQEILLDFLPRQRRLFLGLPGIFDTVLQAIGGPIADRAGLEAKIEETIQAHSKTVLKKQTRARSTIMNRSRISSPYVGDADQDLAKGFENPLHSHMVRNAKIVMRKAGGLVNSTWKYSLAVITFGHFLHIFDLPETADVGYDMSMNEAFDMLKPSLAVEGDITEKKRQQTRILDMITPGVSVHLVNCDLVVPIYPKKILEIVERPAQKRVFVTLASAEKVANWVDVLRESTGKGDTAVEENAPAESEPAPAAAVEMV